MLKHDVVIVGAGLAGLRCALEINIIAIVQKNEL
jgi:succinate dehydrogenase/fumarate reductase flavoprotein subunit